VKRVQGKGKEGRGLGKGRIEERRRRGSRPAYFSLPSAAYVYVPYKNVQINGFLS